MNPRTLARSLSGFLILELASLALFRSAIGSWVLLAIVAGAMVYIGIRQPRLGCLLLLGELIVGSKGYLISAELHGFRVSLRLVAFVAFLLGYLLGRIHSGWNLDHLRPYRWWLTVFGASFVGAAFLGIIHHHGLAAVFLDGNAFLYLALWIAYGGLRSADRADFVSLIVAGAIWVGLKSYIVLAWFAHGPHATLPFVYHWIRDTGVGEISPIIGSVYRVFFQSQIYSVLGSLLALGLLIPELRRPQVRFLPGGLLVAFAAGGIAVSLSRSFWLGTGVGLLTLILVSRLYRSPTAVIRMTGLLGGILLLQLFLTSWALNFPLPLSSRGLSGGDLVAGRLSSFTTEPAASSRLELLRPLTAQALHSPLWGSGLAQTVTYTSNDPRVRQVNPSGRFTTYTFEWGYLDQLVKFGLIGTVAFLGLWVTLLVRLWRRRRDAMVLGALAATVALLAVHVTSPYLNHPLGLGWLMVADLISRDA